MDYKDFLCDDLFLHWRIQPTKELDDFWKKYLEKNNEMRGPFHEAIEVFELIRDGKGIPQTIESSKIWAFIEKTEKKKRKRLIITMVSAVAAALVILILSTLFVLHENPENAALTITSIGEVMSNSNVQLYTGDNMLEIDNNSTLDLYGKKESAVISNSSTQKEIDLNNNQTNKLIVPYGKRSTLILADGSKVHLNSGTKMEFPTTFSTNKREINVEGEIFIEVAKLNNVPFVIHTPHSQITVHGTSFNVSSYIEDSNESVVLVNGTVEVKSQHNTIQLQPNEMAEIENGLILHKKVDVADYISWINGYMQFNKLPLSELLKKIGRYYNVEFQYNPDLSLLNQTCSGKLFLSDNLNDVLETFSTMTYLQYDNKENEIFFIHQ